MKKLSRVYYLRGKLYGPDTPWKDIPDDLKERDEYVNSDEYKAEVKRRDPGRDLDAEQKRMRDAEVQRELSKSLASED